MFFIKFSRLFFAVLFFLAGSLCFASGKKEAERVFPPLEPETVKSYDVGSYIPEPRAVESYAVDTPAMADFPVPSRGELVMGAFSKAYPTKVSPVQFRNGDWAVQIYGKWFYYAEGRLLPEELLDKKEQYSLQNLYQYAPELPSWEKPSAETVERLRRMAENRRTSTVKRSPHIYNTLWRSETRDDAWNRVKQIRFLGQNLLVHYSILEVLCLIEEKILDESTTNPDIKQWINGLGTVEGWNWRDIADSSNRSFHSYGVAIDLLPKSLGGLETYWLWTAKHTPDWWNVPYSRRYHPPHKVIKIFESYGFLWGGKWVIYDTMHFEYRPEIFIFNNLPLEQVR